MNDERGGEGELRRELGFRGVELRRVEMVEEEKRKRKVGPMNRRPKLAEARCDSDDDEPIGSLLKLKKLRGAKRAARPALDAGAGDRGGMGDTLASLKRRLKVPKRARGGGWDGAGSLSNDGGGALDRGPAGDGADEAGAGVGSGLNVGSEGPLGRKAKRQRLRKQALDLSGGLGKPVRRSRSASGRRPKGRGLGLEESLDGTAEGSMRDSLSSFFWKARSSSSRASSDGFGRGSDKVSTGDAPLLDPSSRSLSSGTIFRMSEGGAGAVSDETPKDSLVGQGGQTAFGSRNDVVLDRQTVKNSDCVVLAAVRGANSPLVQEVLNTQVSDNALNTPLSNLSRKDELRGLSDGLCPSSVDDPKKAYDGSNIDLCNISSEQNLEGPTSVASRRRDSELVPGQRERSKRQDDGDGVLHRMTREVLGRGVSSKGHPEVVTRELSIYSVENLAKEMQGSNQLESISKAKQVVETSRSKDADSNASVENASCDNPLSTRAALKEGVQRDCSSLDQNPCSHDMLCPSSNDFGEVGCLNAGKKFHAGSFSVDRKEGVIACVDGQLNGVCGESPINDRLDNNICLNKQSVESSKVLHSTENVSSTIDANQTEGTGRCDGMTQPIHREEEPQPNKKFHDLSDGYSNDFKSVQPQKISSSAAETKSEANGRSGDGIGKPCVRSMDDSIHAAMQNSHLTSMRVQNGESPRSSDGNLSVGPSDGHMEGSLDAGDNVNGSSDGIIMDSVMPKENNRMDCPEHKHLDDGSKVLLYAPDNEAVETVSISYDLKEICSDDVGQVCLKDKVDNRQSEVQRASRKIKKHRLGDMAYEGDSDWETLINEQGIFGSNHVHGEQSTRTKDKSVSLSSISADVDNEGVAPVAAGLKVRAAGPVEKIKFKELLKKRGGLQEYLECRNFILRLWSIDVGRILPLVECGVTNVPLEDESPRASLIREIYAFLDHSGYINTGIAVEKVDKPHGFSQLKRLSETNIMENSLGQISDSEKNYMLNDTEASNRKSGLVSSSMDAHVGCLSFSLAADTKVVAEKSSYQGVLLGTGTCMCVKSDHVEDCVNLRATNTMAELDSKPIDQSIKVGDGDHEIAAGFNDSQSVDGNRENLIRAENIKVETSGRDPLGFSESVQCDSQVRRRVVVVGAGPGGLAAARHLQRQGFSVCVLEARDRIGGRVHTDCSSLSVPVDLGASIITGVEADVATERRPDPSSLICAQLGLELSVLNSDCPLYDIITGRKVPTDLDEALEAEYNSLLDDMVVLVAQNGEGAMKMSLEEGLEYALKRRRMSRLSGAARDLSKFNADNCSDVVDSSLDGYYCTALESGNHDKTLYESSLKQGLLNPLERRVMDWHFANLEYGCAALLKEVSLPYWNQDDVYGGFGGAHCMIKGGYGAVVESLSKGLDIHMNHIVTDVAYSTRDVGATGSKQSEVRVSTSSGSEFVGDAVLITVPLGCLKANTIKFSPSLPEWKMLSIQRLGFGVLNKVILEFPVVFWDDTVDYFGATAEETDRRGQCFMFWNVRKTVGAPVLIALVVGKAAIEGQNMSKSDHVNHALLVLRKLFGEASVPDPVASVVTNWGKDPFSRGAYSYVAIGASGEDYDILARPVENCLFFAGEATCKEHPDTVGGAMMSGLREAVRIIDILTTGNDHTAEVEAIEALQRHTDTERNEVRDMMKRLDAVELSTILCKNSWDGAEKLLSKEALLRDIFTNVKTTPARLHLAKELLRLPVEVLKSFSGTKEGLRTLNSWILDSMGKDGTQLLRHCVRLLVLVSTDLLAVRWSGIGRTIKEKVCVHTSRDIRAVASQLVNMWIEVFRKEKVSIGRLKLLKQNASDSVKPKTKDTSSGKPPVRSANDVSNGRGNSRALSSAGSLSPSSTNNKKRDSKPAKFEISIDTKSEVNSSRPHHISEHQGPKAEKNHEMSEEEAAAFAAAEKARAAALAAAEAYASSEAECSRLRDLPKIPSFHKFARREQYAQVDESDPRERKWLGGILGRQDCISEIDSRNCRVRNWSLDFSATCGNIDSSRMSGDNCNLQSYSNDVACHLNLKEHSGESVAIDSRFTKAWVDSAGTGGVKDFHAIEMWQSQALDAAPEFFRPSLLARDEEDSNRMSRQSIGKSERHAEESSVSQDKGSFEDHPKGAEHVKQAVVDYVASLLMPLYKTRKIDKEGYKSIMKKSTTKVMEHRTEAERVMTVSEFLDFKRRNKIRSFVDKLIERHMAMHPTAKT